MSIINQKEEEKKELSDFEDEFSNAPNYSQSSKRTNKIDENVKEIQARMDIFTSLNERKKIKDKTDFAVAEKVIDKNTALILYRYRNVGLIGSLHGCISTGKEANVYFGIGGKKSSVDLLAIKIYKTAVLDYKDRRRYLEGDFRLRYWNVGKNTRRIVRKWAEKEMRNLLRIEKANIPSPKPITVKGTVLIMEFLGRNDVAFPTLKNADIPDHFLESIYLQGMLILKKLYFDCKLIHADFSEYNLLVDTEPEPPSKDGDYPPKLYVIDVSQAIENKSEMAFEFLKCDINNFLLYISKKGLTVPSLQTIYKLIIDDSIDENAFHEILVSKLQKYQENSDSEDIYYEDFVFQNTLNQQNLQKLESLQLSDKEENSEAENTDIESSKSENQDSDVTVSEENEDFDEFDVKEFIRVKKVETPEERKLRRKQNKIEVKALNKSKRQVKMSKKEKNQLIKKSKNKRNFAK